MKHLNDLNIIIAALPDQNGLVSNREISRHPGASLTTAGDRPVQIFENDRMKIDEVFDTETFVVLRNIGLYIPFPAKRHLMGCNEKPTNKKHAEKGGFTGKH
ncbi:hypothetical protein LLG96_08710 [bacterium]|nr:hypothetical protein [bacterium]